MNRYLVVEAVGDGEFAKLNPLNIHPSWTSLYFYYPSDVANKRLHVIDLKYMRTYSWQEASDQMLIENLKRIQNNKAITRQAEAVLLGAKLIDGARQLTQAGWDVYHRLNPPPPLEIALGHIRGTTRLRL